MKNEESAAVSGVRYLLAAGLLLGWLLNLRYLPWSSFYADAALSLTWMAALLIVLLQALAGHGRQRTLVPLPALASLAAAVLVLGQWASGQMVWAGDAWLPLAFWTGLALAQILGANLRDDPARPDRWEALLAGVCLGAALVSTALAFMQWFGLTWIGLWLFEVPAHTRPGANLAQANHLSMLLLWGLASLVYLRRTARVPTRHALAAAALLVMGLAVTESRFIWLVLPIWLLIEWRQHGKGPLLRLRAPLLMLMALYLATYLAFQFLALEYIVESPFGGRLVASGRLQIWAQMLQAISIHPWVGWGWNQVVVAQYQSAASAGDFAFRYATNAHAVLLDLALWCGVPMALLFFGAALHWLWRTGVRASGAQSRYLWLCLVMLFIYAFAEFPYEYGYFLWPAGWMIGRLARLEPGQRLWRVHPAAPGGLLLACLGVWATMLADYRVLEQDFTRMMFEGRGFNGAAGSPPASRVHLLTQLQAYIDEERVAFERYQTPADDQRLQDVVARYPFPSLLEKHARLLVHRGELSRAREEMLKIGYLFGARSYERARKHWLELAAQADPALGALVLPAKAPAR